VSDDKVVKLHTAKSGKDPDAMLEMAKGDFKKLCILGVNTDGRVEARATNSMGLAELVYLIEHLKQILLCYDPTNYDEDEEDE